MTIKPKRFSVIIPVFNAEKYIERCVDSCMNQGLEEGDFEILLCNDGSTDSSLAIAEDLSRKHNCIKVFTQENAGAGMARNLGLVHAIGNYVIFVDSDDYLVSNSLKPLLEKCEELDLDICKYVIKCINLYDGTINTRFSPVGINTVFTGYELLANPAVPLDSACSSFYKRQLLEDNNIIFGNQTSSEDVVFNIHAYPHAKRVMFSNKHVYTYEVRIGSRGHSIDYLSRKRYLLNNIKNAGLVMSYAKAAELQSDSINKSLLKRANSMTVGAILELLQGKSFFSRNDAIEALDSAINLGLYLIHGKTFSWKTTLLAHLMLNRKKMFLSRFSLNKNA